MKTNILTILAVLVFTTVASAEKLGYIDIQRAILATSAGKKAKKQIEKEVGVRKKQLEKKRADLQKMQKDFEKKSLVLSDDVKAKKAAEIQREGMKLQEMFVKSQQELQGKERSLQEPILKTLQAVISDIAKKDGYDMIFEKTEQRILWAKKNTDLTDKVVKAFEKKHK